MLILPELIVLGTAFAIILTDLFIEERHRPLLGWLAVLGLAAAAVLAIASVPMEGQMFGDRFAMDSVTWWFKLLFLAAALITVLLSIDLLEGRATALATSRYGFRGEYYAILLFTVAGMLFLASARDLATLYVSLELTTIPLFILAAWKKDAFSTEAGLKYLVLGALASALLLYGLGIFYGLAGATDLASLGRLDPANAAFWLAAALVTAGVGFKMTIVPFHFWAADVYQGAPTPVTAYLSVASKGAGLVLMFHLFYRILGRSLDDLTTLLAVLAAVTMTVGNLAAVTQKNIKRLMAFSAVSQAGYLIMGFIGHGSENVPAMIFYMAIYIVTNLAVFSAIIIHSNETGSELVTDYRGLSRSNPLLALGMMIALFGLAGIPPLSGFVGKFFLFNIASKAGLHWLVAVAAVNATVSLYYYLRIVRQMYIEPAAENSRKLRVTPVLGVTLTATALASVVLGIVPFFYDVIQVGTSRWIETFLS